MSLGVSMGGYLTFREVRLEQKCRLFKWQGKNCLGTFVKGIEAATIIHAIIQLHELVHLMTIPTYLVE